MNSFKKMYRNFFGITEQSLKDNLPTIDANKTKAVQDYTAALNDLSDTLSDGVVDEAQLVNRITDYRGGVEYVLRNPAEAQSVAQEIKNWAEEKGFTVINHILSPSGKVGYFYFRLGQDPSLESQKLQGYLAQKPELKHFRFNIRLKKQKTQEKF